MDKQSPKSNKDFFITHETRDNLFALFVDTGMREKYTSEKRDERKEKVSVDRRSISFNKKE
jgi:hypothetical protein